VRRETAKLYQELYDEGYDPHLELSPALAIIAVVSVAFALLALVIAFFALASGSFFVNDIFKHMVKHYCQVNGEGRCIPVR
jgi:hypothetical protein